MNTDNCFSSDEMEQGHDQTGLTQIRYQSMETDRQLCRENKFRVLTMTWLIMRAHVPLWLYAEKLLSFSTATAGQREGPCVSFWSLNMCQFTVFTH